MHYIKSVIFTAYGANIEHFILTLLLFQNQIKVEYTTTTHKIYSPTQNVYEQKST